MILRRFESDAANQLGSSGAAAVAANLVYYALVCRSFLLASTRAKRIAELSWQNPSRSIPLAWLDDIADEIGVSTLEAEAAALLRDTCGGPLLDHLRPLYEELISPRLRRRWGEFHTPDWLADHVVSQCWMDGASWLDPSAGSGAMALSLARHAREYGGGFAFCGIEANPWSALAAAANAAFASAWLNRGPQPEFQIPIACFDVVGAEPPDDMQPTFDRIVGNPPWIVWDRLGTASRSAASALWRRYGLLSESGMSGILGGGKKDLAMLVTYVAADRYLRDGGKLAFVITQSVFKSAGAARGFRRFELPDGAPLRVLRVDDFSQKNPFPQISNRAAIIVLEKGIRTKYPIDYFVRNRSGEPIRCAARPVDPHDPLSPWMHSPIASDQWLDRVFGACAYRPYLGANTGGASGIFWFERIAAISEAVWRMRNLRERGRKAVRAVEADFEAEMFFPCLIGKDVRAWSAAPSSWLLVVQDPERRRGIEPDSLRQIAPGVYEYLNGFEDLLRARALFRRYFRGQVVSGEWRDRGAFYSMFNVAKYTFCEHKVVWNRLGNTMAAAAVACFEGKPVFPQETHAFFVTDSAEESHYLAALLNSRWVALAMQALAQVGGKSFATPATVQRLRLDKFDASNRVHQMLSAAGSDMTRAFPSQPEQLLKVINDAAAEYWGIPPAC